MSKVKVLIEIDEEYLDIVRGAKAHGADFKPYNIIANGTPLNGTNGEVLLKMFPPSVYFPSDGTYMALLTKDCLVSCSNVDWWNAEYKGAK